MRVIIKLASTNAASVIATTGSTLCNTLVRALEVPKRENDAELNIPVPNILYRGAGC